MHRFRCRAIDGRGRSVCGEHEAESADALRARLESEGLRVESIEPLASVSVFVAGGEAIADLRDRDFAAPSRVAPSGPGSAAFGSRGGLPLDVGLRALGEECSSRAMRRALGSLSDRLSRGEPLSQVVAGDVAGVPHALLEVLRASLATDRPEVVVQAWSEHAGRSDEVRRTIGGRALYLLLLTMLTALVVFFLLWLVPGFEAVYDDFGIKLPILTDVLMRTSRLVRDHGLGVAAALGVVAAVAVGVAWATPRRTRDRLFATVPLIGPVRRNLSLATFCRLLAVLTEHRAPFPLALRAAGAGSRDGEIEDACRLMADELERGPSDATAADPSRIPTALTSTMRWSNRPDVFSQALRGSAAVFEEQARARARIVPTIVEPLVLVGVGAGILLGVVALFLPMLSLMHQLSS